MFYKIDRQPKLLAETVRKAGLARAGRTVENDVCRACRFLPKQVKNVIDNLWFHRVGVEGNRIRINFSEEFSLDICAARALQQIQKTGIHRKRVMAI